MSALLLGLWLAAAFVHPAAAEWDAFTLGEAEVSVPAEWELTNQRRDVEVDFSAPSGEYLMVFWWFPDEPLTGYNDEISSETRHFPAGPALVVRSTIGRRAIVKVAFERENEDGDRLLLVLESENASPAALEATLEPILQRLRFAGDPEQDTQAPRLVEPPGREGEGDWRHDAAGGFSLRVLAGWTTYDAALPGGRSLTVVPPGTDALLLVGVSDGQDESFIEAFETRFYQDVAIPRQIEAESHEPFAGIPGHAVTVSARIYPAGAIALPYRRGVAWAFRGIAGGRPVMLAYIHGNDAPQVQRAALGAIAASFVLGPPPSGDEAPVPPAVSEPPAASDPAPGRKLSASEALALASAHLGDSCQARQGLDMPVAQAVAALGLAPEAVAACSGKGVDILVVVLPQDPRAAQNGVLGMAYLRAHLAAGGKPVAFVDPSRRLLVTIDPAGPATIAAGVEALHASAGSGRPAGDALFAGAPSPRWQLHLARGGKAEWTRFDDGAFVADVPEGDDRRTTGLRSAAPVVKLPGPRDGFTARLRFDVEAAMLRNAVFALVPTAKAGEYDWDSHEIWLGVEHRQDAEPELILAAQRQVLGRLGLSDTALLAGLTLEVRPDGALVVSNGEGRLLIEGNGAPDPDPGPFHIQVSATAPAGGLPAHLALRSVVHEEPAFDLANDPDALLGDAPRRLVLFDGLALGPRFAVSAPHNAQLAGKLAIADGLKVDAAEGAGRDGLGLFSPEPAIWLDRFGAGASARLRLEFDPKATAGVQVALVEPSGGESGLPRSLLHWRRMPDGALYVTRAVDRKEPRHARAEAGMPETVELVLTPDGVQVLAEGFPDDVLPWPSLREGTGLRVHVAAMADHAGLPARMFLCRMTLERTAGEHAEAGDGPAGVAPLPAVRFLPGGAMSWQGYGLAGQPFDEAGRFEVDGSLVVDVAAKYEGGRAGMVSLRPVADLDHRIGRTAYRLALRFDPARTDGFEAFLSGDGNTDMANGAAMAVRLVRQTEGRLAGDWLLHLRAGAYAYWTRRLPAEAMAAWDGRLRIDLREKAATLSLPGIATLQGSEFSHLVEGAKLHMTVHSRSATPYGPAKMALLSVDGGWVTPRGMTARARSLLVGAEAFDAAGYVKLLRDELAETAR